MIQLFRRRRGNQQNQDFRSQAMSIRMRRQIWQRLRNYQAFEFGTHIRVSRPCLLNQDQPHPAWSRPLNYTDVTQALQAVLGRTFKQGDVPLLELRSKFPSSSKSGGTGNYHETARIPIASATISGAAPGALFSMVFFRHPFCIEELLS